MGQKRRATCGRFHNSMTCTRVPMTSELAWIGSTSMGYINRSCIPTSVDSVVRCSIRRSLIPNCGTSVFERTTMQHLRYRQKVVVDWFHCPNFHGGTLMRQRKSLSGQSQNWVCWPAQRCFVHQRCTACHLSTNRSGPAFSHAAKNMKCLLVFTSECQVAAPRSHGLNQTLMSRLN